MTLKEQILEIRDGGKYNMFDANGVQREAFELGYHELVCFIEEHRGDYMRFIMTGDEKRLEVM